MAWNFVDRIWYNDVSGQLVIQYNVELPPESYPSYGSPFERYECAVLTLPLLNETKIGEEHPAAQDDSVAASHSGRCDGQPPS